MTTLADVRIRKLESLGFLTLVLITTAAFAWPASSSGFLVLWQMSGEEYAETAALLREPTATGPALPRA